MWKKNKISKYRNNKKQLEENNKIKCIKPKRIKESNKLCIKLKIINRKIYNINIHYKVKNRYFKYMKKNNNKE